MIKRLTCIKININKNINTHIYPLILIMIQTLTKINHNKTNQKSIHISTYINTINLI